MEVFSPYTRPNRVRESSLIDSFDIKTRRFVLRAGFQEKLRTGFIIAEVLCVPGSEPYLERLSVHVEKPVEETLRVVELHQPSDDDLMQRLTAYNKAMVEEVAKFTPERAYRRMAENRVNNQ